jgi:hypothetical protein
VPQKKPLEQPKPVDTSKPDPKKLQKQETAPVKPVTNSNKTPE